MESVVLKNHHYGILSIKNHSTKWFGVILVFFGPLVLDIPILDLYLK